MLENTEKIRVRNRKKGSVGYSIPDLSINRLFRQNEIKEITMEELRKLSYIPGGKTLIDNYLLIENEEAIKELVGDIEPEYNYTEKEVKWLLEYGSLDQLKDCLNFAPLGVIDILKNLAIELKVDNISKRKVIEEKTGLNVSRAIEIKEEIEKDIEQEKAEPTERKAAPVILDKKENKGRKAELPNYNIIPKK